MTQSRSRPRSRKRLAVFLDPQHRRAHWLKIVAALTGFAVLAWVVTVAIGIYFVDILPASARLDAIRKGTVAESGAVPIFDGPTCTLRTVRPVTAWLRNPADLATANLAPGCPPLGGLLLEALVIDPATQAVVWSDRPALTAAARTLAGAAAPEIELVARLPLPRAEPGARPVLETAAARGRIVLALRAAVVETGAAGLCLYPTEVGFGDLDGLMALFAELRPALPPGVGTCLVAEAEGPLWRDAALTGAVDSVVLRAFREARPGAPAPLAPQAWFDGVLEEAVAALGPDRLRVALGSFGQLWTAGRAAPVALPFVEAMRLAAQNRGRIALDPASLNTRIGFDTPEGAAQIWLLDAASLHNQLLTLARLGAPRALLWSAGQEDPAAWSLLSLGGAPVPPGVLEPVRFPGVVSYIGSGPFRKVITLPVPGARRAAFDPLTRRITALTYDRIPLPFTLQRYGAPRGKVVALTFDDGPDALHTASILDILKREGVPATFFVIGSNMVQFPDLVRRMVDEGHEVGSHTFFHPTDQTSAGERLRLELNAFQRLLASVTGRTTFLFRAPYGRSEGPMTQDEAARQLIVEQAGLVVAGGDIGPRDWEGLSAGQIVDEVLANLTPEGGQVIVLHDAGGDRAATVAAVSDLIRHLRAEGYSFVPLSSFIGLTRDEVMPVASDALTPVDRAYYETLSGLGRALVWIFWGAIGFGVARGLFVLALALGRRRHPSTPTDRPVAVLIPAYNEELVIGDAIAAALASDHRRLRVIVIDDGSTDDTAAVVRRDFGTDPRVTLLQQPNGGKWSALNAGFAALSEEIVVAVDADTVLEPDAVRLLAGHFDDPAVGAVAGTVRVGNRHGLLTRLQALEYIAAQNIERRAAERLNAMLVVPGSIGAWRAEAVRRVGLYSPDTLTEDADLTVALIRAGYRVVFEDRAFSTTDGVESLRAFMKQRLRWSFGMLQMSWKHRRAARTARGVGLFALPDLWLTGLLLGLLAPVVDAVAVGAFVSLVATLLQETAAQPQAASGWMLAGWLALPLLDLVVILAAFGFARREPWSLVLLFPLQRLVYRPLLYVTVYRAVGLALAGRLAGWGKLVRRGRVERPLP